MGGSGSDGAMYAVEFDWPRDDVLVARSLAVRAARVGSATILRVDAASVWQPVRPPATLVPATAQTLVVSYQPTYLGSGSSVVKSYGPVTNSKPAQVAAVAAEVNAMPVEPDGGVRPCPAPVAQLDLSFRSATGAEVAHAQASVGGCDDIYVQVDTATTTLTGAGTLTASVLTTLHLPWPTLK